MARKPSVILTPSEKKEAVSGIKTASKAAKTELAAIHKERKTLDREYLAANKELKKNHDAAIKALDKREKDAQKSAVSADFELSKLVGPPKAVPSPTS